VSARTSQGLLRQSRLSRILELCSTAVVRLLEAQRYPEDFDGIIANAPWVDQTGFTIGAMWNQKAISETPITNAKMVLVADKVIQM
jgi:hypothetical protein